MSEFFTFTEPQKVAITLIRNDFRFVYTILCNQEQIKTNYISFSMPLLGTIMDGAEDWVKAFNNSSQTKLTIPTFTAEEQVYYEEMRSAIKLWDNSYDNVYEGLKKTYHASDSYFSNLCKPIAKALHLYDIFGVDLVNGEFCGNTILGSFCAPQYRFGENDGEKRKKYAEIMGAYTVAFGALKQYSVNRDFLFDYRDYGGFEKSPVGNEINDKFVLFSLLCQIQFVILCVEKYITEECTTKLRFSYLQYYYLCGILPEINEKLQTQFSMDSAFVSSAFRNAMAHYKIGVALKPNEIIYTDPFFGLTQKFFICDYYATKKFVLDNLLALAIQIKEYLHIDKG